MVLAGRKLFLLPRESAGGTDSMEQVITTAHGSGGSATGELIRDIFAKEFHDEMDDAAVLDAETGTHGLRSPQTASS
jgi:hypothetical protein